MNDNFGSASRMNLYLRGDWGTNPEYPGEKKTDNQCPKIGVPYWGGGNAPRGIEPSPSNIGDKL